MVTGSILGLVAILSVICCSFGGFQTTKLGPKPIWNNTYTDNLRHDLLLNYDKFARPAQHYNVTLVKLAMSIKHLEVNEFKSTLTVHTWFKMFWQDEKLKWDPTKYGGLQVLNLADHEIWQPDIFLYNSATSTAINHFNTHCLVYPDGNVLWVPPAQFAVLCDLNLKYWPFDSQDCTLKFGSWTYHGEQINLEIYRNNDSGLKLELLVENSEWRIRSASIKRNVTYYTCCEEPYPDISINLILDRVSPSYRVVIVTPAIVIIFLILVTFWLPPDAGEKILINGCSAIIICLFMLYFTQKLPAMGTHTPLIVVFYSSCLYIVIFSMIGSVAVITLSRSKHTKPLPWIIKLYLVGKLGKYLGLANYIPKSTMSIHRVTAEEMRDHQVTDFDDMHVSEEHGIVKSQQSAKCSLQDDWVLLAAVIDKISFIFYCFLFLILAIVYSL